MCSFDARKKRINQATLGREVGTGRRRSVKDCLPVPYGEDEEPEGASLDGRNGTSTGAIPRECDTSKLGGGVNPSAETIWNGCT